MTYSTTNVQASVDLTVPMQLVYRPKTEQERVVVQFPQGLGQKAIFSESDYFLRAAMKTVGIPIPLQERNQYPEFQSDQKRQAIYLEDTSFGKAFYCVYFRQSMDPSNFYWQKI